MSLAPWWAIALAMVLLFWVVGAVSRLKRLRADIAATFSNLDVQLRRRHELAQRLHTLLRPQRPDAHDPLERLLAASSQVLADADLVRGQPHQSSPLHASSMAEDVFQEAHARLVDALQAQEPIVDPDAIALLDELQLADSQARFARGLFNEAAQAFNQARLQWPTRAVASVFGFQRAGLLSLSPSRLDNGRPAA